MKKILFIGNSYTYFNDMPDIFARICKENGILSSPDECFGFMNELPEKYSQMSLF